MADSKPYNIYYASLQLLQFLCMCSINLVVGVCTGQITWIADLWLVVGHAIIDLAAPLIYVTSIFIIVYQSIVVCRVKSNCLFLRGCDCRP